MLIIYLGCALVTAIAAMAAAIRFSDARTAPSPLSRLAVAGLAGALWPIMAVGVLSLMVIVPLLKLLGIAPAAETPADAPTFGLALAEYRHAA
ncbi:MAG: hypothetical protein AB7G47_22205 [Mycolicibacterium sp.]|uniref:hypothetical protein n=1 Tax=Mycolicibacterium sp. TaxID=2320850 RepID=UPI003D0EF6CD